MNKQNKFAGLSREDQQRAIAICDQHTYEEAVLILARPRPEGFDMKTSVSALCRFYNRWNPLGLSAELRAQLAQGLQLQQHLSGQTFHEAILTLVQCHLLGSLRDGKELNELLPAFRIMNNLQRHHLAVLRSGAQPSSDPLVVEHLEREKAAQEQPDFIVINRESTPRVETSESTTGPLTPAQPAVPVDPAPNLPPSNRQSRPSVPAFLTAIHFQQTGKKVVELNRAKSDALAQNSSADPAPFHIFHQIPPSEPKNIPSASIPESEARKVA